MYSIGYQITTMADRLIGNGDGTDVSVDTNYDDDGGGGYDTDDDDVWRCK